MEPTGAKGASVRETPRQALQATCSYWWCWWFGPEEVYTKDCPFSDGTYRPYLYCLRCRRGIPNEL